MTLKKINAICGNTIKVFTKSKDKVSSKFLMDGVKGVIMGQSMNISGISRAIEPDCATSARHVFKRLDRNLGQRDLRFLKLRAQKKQCAMIDDDTLIYFDPTEVVKPHGEKFEALSRVRDGSEGGKTLKNGYPVSACVAMKGDELIPLDFSLYSYRSEDFESANVTHLGEMDAISNLSKRKGTFVLDRGFDAFAVIRHLHLTAADFIIRMCKVRKYHKPGEKKESYARHEIIKKHSKIKVKAEFELKIDKKLKKKNFTIQAADVELVSGKIDSAKKLTLIRAKASKKLTLYLLTNLDDITPEKLISIVCKLNIGYILDLVHRLHFFIHLRIFFFLRSSFASA